MRHGRAKLARRTLQFYRIHSPHLLPGGTHNSVGTIGRGGDGQNGGGRCIRVLLDGTFLVAAVRNKVPLFERLKKMLQGEAFACCATRSTLEELESLSVAAAAAKRKQAGSGGGDEIDDSGESDDCAFAKARRYGLDECEIIEPDDVPNAATDDGADAAGAPEFSKAMRDVRLLATKEWTNELGYFVATQDESLSDVLRSSPYVPLLRLARGVLLLESPSATSRRKAAGAERSKLFTGGGSGSMNQSEREFVKTVKKEDRAKQKENQREEKVKAEKKAVAKYGAGFGSGDPNGRRRKKKSGNPNPLSCKKRKTA